MSYPSLLFWAPGHTKATCTNWPTVLNCWSSETKKRHEDPCPKHLVSSSKRGVHLSPIVWGSILALRLDFLHLGLFWALPMNRHILWDPILILTGFPVTLHSSYLFFNTLPNRYSATLLILSQMGFTPSFTHQNAGSTSYIAAVLLDLKNMVAN